MTTLPNMGLTLPTRGSSGAGAWGDTLDANLALEDAHDHSSGKGARIPTAGISINADLPFSSLYAPTQLHRLQFSEIAGGGLSNANNLSLFISDGTGGLTAHELYFRTSAGNNIRFTFGSSLNVAAFVGGIGGDYSSVSALLSYDDAGKQYKHFQGGGTAWARMTGGGLRLIEFGTTETLYVEQLAPAALASSYSVTWPVALPGAQTLTQISNVGQLVFSNTIAVDQSLTVSGTGRFKHGTLTKQIAGVAFTTVAGNYAFSSPAFGASQFLGGTASGAAAAIDLPQGARIVAVRFYILDSATGPTKAQGQLNTATSTGTFATVASSAVSSGAGANQTLTIGSLTTTVSSATMYYLQIIPTTGTSAIIIYGAEVDYDWP